MTFLPSSILDPVLGLVVAAGLFLILGVAIRSPGATWIRKAGDHPLADLVDRAGRALFSVGVLALILAALLIIIALVVAAARGIAGGAP